MTTTDHVVGVHLDHVHARSSVVVVRRLERIEGAYDRKRRRWPTVVRLEVPYIDRPPAGTRYPDIADRLAELLPRLSGQIVVAVDISVSGLPPIGLLREHGVKAVPVHVATRPTARAAKGAVFLPRRDLVSCTAILLGEKRLMVAKMPEADTLAAALDRFREEAGDHDDLVLATALASWWASNRFGSRVHQPPAPRLPVEVRPPTWNEAAARRR